VIKTSNIVKIFSVALTVAMLAAGCGGGGGGGTSALPIGGGGNTNPSTPLNTATLKGEPGFVTSAGMTVYVFDADLNTPNQSQCNGACAGVWPPVAPPSGSMPSGWTSFQRQDGSMQLAYQGRPLYTFTGDTAAGQTNGDGVTAYGAVWHIARPASAPSPSPTASSGGGGY
jgi:predicted lipoprotein with Yx(FWY)xxD motif